MMKRFWQNNSISVLCAKLGATVVMMFIFAIFIMPPLYDLFCEVTGLNGKTAGPLSGVTATRVDASGVDLSRTIKVQFVATNNEYMPWQFKPSIKTVRVHPGKPTQVTYFAHNPTNKPMVAQAIPSLVPIKAASYFHKTECFCFNQQPLAAGESAELGLSFIVDIDIPKQVNTITLSYTLFDVTKATADSTTYGVNSVAIAAY